MAALHPDHLQPGDNVGAWRIVQILGRGGSSRVFKVERDGLFYAMKTALRPLSGVREELSDEEQVEEASAYRKLAREAAALFTYAAHPNLLRVHAVDFWPNPRSGYGYLVTDYVDGDSWHQARWRKPFTAARLVDTFSDVVRTVGVLHERGVYHRDLKADNLLLRREDGRPFLIDFGTVRLPGALTQTMGVPEGVLHLLPPELLAYTRAEGWKRGVPFQGGVSADLYALGVLLYQALTDLHPFDPELPDKELLAAIADTPPTPPHLLNPLVPRALSDITSKLLEKQPEARYPDTRTLLQALEQAAEEERHSPAWKVPLTEPDPGAVEASTATDHVRAPAPPRGTGRARGRLATMAALLVVMVALGGLFGRHLLESSPESAPGASVPNPRGSPPVHSTSQDFATSSRPTSLSGLITVWICAATGLGCPAAQVMPARSPCPPGATESMFQELKMTTGSFLRALVDVSQPEEVGADGVYAEGLYRAGPLVGRVTVGEGRLVEGTLLYGELWTGPGMKDDLDREVIIGRYSWAVLPDGKKYPVCIALGGAHGRLFRNPGAKAGTVELPRDSPVNAVWHWP